MSYKVTCPCGGSIEADDEEGLVSQVQDHAKNAHDLDLSREQVLEMAESA
jgi:predicted small metal-binding protein